jgi:hypothetical protein
VRKYTAQPALGQRGEDGGRSDTSAGGGQRQNFYAGRQSALRSFCCHQQAADAIVDEHLGAGRKPPVWVEHDARRMRPGDPPHRQQRIVGECRADANDDRIDERA